VAGRFVYVSDFGKIPISDKTIAAYQIEFLVNPPPAWRRSSRKRRLAARFNEDMAAAMRYFWTRDEERSEL
jgi:uncharacterized protein YraI